MSEYAALTNEQLIEHRLSLQDKKASIYVELDIAEAEARTKALGRHPKNVTDIRGRACEILDELRRIDAEMTSRSMDYPLYFGSRTRQKREPND